MRAGLYLGGDEIGQLGRQFEVMLRELEHKQALEKQMIMADRLASMGRLTAGIAHEINNPLGGMLNAVNTCKRHGNADPITARTISLLERGLLQIKETLGALLVEARIESHALTRDDVEDVRTLVAPEVDRKALALRWDNRVASAVPLPSTQVRQVLINLLLNAVQAASADGDVACSVRRSPRGCASTSPTTAGRSVQSSSSTCSNLSSARLGPDSDCGWYIRSPGSSVEKYA